MIITKLPSCITTIIRSFIQSYHVNARACLAPNIRSLDIRFSESYLANPSETFERWIIYQIHHNLPSDFIIDTGEDLISVENCDSIQDLTSWVVRRVKIYLTSEPNFQNGLSFSFNSEGNEPTIIFEHDHIKIFNVTSIAQLCPTNLRWRVGNCLFSRLGSAGDNSCTLIYDDQTHKSYIVSPSIQTIERCARITRFIQEQDGFLYGKLVDVREGIQPRLPRLTSLLERCSATQAATQTVRQSIRRSDSDKKRRISHQTTDIPVPYMSFKKSAKVQTNRDLKRTRVSILRVLRKIEKNNQRNNSAVAWKNYKQALIRYGICVACELKLRGFKDTSLDKLSLLYEAGPYEKPQFLKREDYINTCRGYLQYQSKRRYAYQLLFWAFYNKKCERDEVYTHYDYIRCLIGYSPSDLSYNDFEQIKHHVAEKNDSEIPFQQKQEYDWQVTSQPEITYPCQY